MTSSQASRALQDSTPCGQTRQGPYSFLAFVPDPASEFFFCSDGRFEGKGYGPCRVWPQGVESCRARDAWLDVVPQRVRPFKALCWPQYLWLAPHDYPNSGAHRDPRRIGRESAVVLLQHLQHTGPRCSSNREGWDLRCVRMEG